MSEGEVPCYLCGEEVVEGDDYKIHVTIAHGVEYDEERALGGDDSENLTLAENSEIPGEKTDKYIGQLEDVHLGVDDERKEPGEDNALKSFFDTFDEKLKQIKDVAEGKIKPLSFTDDDKIEHVDNNQIWQMFENIKSKVMDIEFPEKPVVATKDPREKLQIQDSDSIHSSAERKWYHGTFYKCKDCWKFFYGEEYFRKHLGSKHKSYPMSIQELRELSSQFEETLYTCKVCEKKVKHEFKNIYVHLKKHSLKMNEYETKFVSVKEELETLPPITNLYEKIPSKRKLESLTGLDETHLTIKVNVEKLYPSKSQIDKTNSSKSPYLQIRPVQSQVEKIPHNTESLRSMAPTPTATILTNHIPTAEEPKPNLIGPSVVVKEEAKGWSGNIPKPQSLYYCPIPGCSFYTTKEGMKSSQAALHLKNDHKIKAKDMKPGMYKFEKVKV